MHSRQTEKDWYDIAFVLLHNDLGGPEEAIVAVQRRFGRELNPLRSALLDPASDFAADGAQGPAAYASQMVADHPEVDHASAVTEAQLSVTMFCQALLD